MSLTNITGTLASEKLLELRSDTFTQPTLEMRQAMFDAVVGDDVYGEDTTVIALEQRTASLFGKEAGLFFPSGTMSNLAAILAWCPERGSEVIVGDKSHVFLYEQTGVCQFGSVSMRTVLNKENGTMDPNEVADAIRPYDIHEPMTRLICLENTHCSCGGKVLPLDFLIEMKALKYPIHMDGARIWNALASQAYDPMKLGQYVSSISVCLSKGLGAPIGSVLVGPKDLIDKARRIRKGLGGGMRQSGIIAAAGLVALDHFDRGLLQEDHRRANALAARLTHIPGIHIETPVETNIIFLRTEQKALDLALRLQSKGIMVMVWSEYRLRIVLHMGITDSDLYRVVEAFL